MKTVIIGGTGTIGRFFASIIPDCVSISRKNYDDLEKEVKDAVYILICVPQERTQKIIDDLKPLLTKQVVIDTSSSMNAPLDMLSSPTAYMHPLFAPTFDTKKKVAVVTKEETLLKPFLEVLELHSIQIIRTTKKEHTACMAYVQALSHFAGMVLAKTLANSRHQDRLMDFSTPYFQLLMDSISRMFSQDAKMYAHIQFENPYFKDILHNYVKEVESLATALDKKDSQVYQELFEQVTKNLPTIMQESYAESNRILNSLQSKISVLGPKGSFSDYAASKLSNKREYAKSFLQVFQQVVSGVSDYALLPIENTVGGGVAEVSDLLLEHRLHIVKEISVPITHCAAGYDVSHVKRIMSHPQALAQCSRYIKKFTDAEVIQTKSTAEALKMIGEEKLKDTIAIGSSFAAKLYGLQVYETGIENSDTNVTRFVLISKKPNKTGKKATIVVVPREDRPGLLFEILEIFYKSNLNLTRLESRPSKREMGLYVFHIDVLINRNTIGYQHVLELLKKSHDVVELGKYDVD